MELQGDDFLTVSRSLARQYGMKKYLPLAVCPNFHCCPALNAGPQSFCSYNSFP